MFSLEEVSCRFTNNLFSLLIHKNMEQNGNYKIILLFIPAIINSLLDITMEGVQSTIYYSFAAILLTSKIMITKKIFANIMIKQ